MSAQRYARFEGLPDTAPVSNRPLAIYGSYFPTLFRLASKSVLDIGCGTSTVGRELDSSVFYVGIDIQDRASSRSVTASAEQLPFSDKSFAVVTALFSLPFWARNPNQVRNFVGECGRVGYEEIWISPDEPSVYVPGGLEGMGPIDAAFKESVAALESVGWSSTTSNDSRRVTHLTRV